MNTNKETHTTEDKKTRSLNPLKYIGMMGACCILPIVILGILPLLPISNLGVNRAIASIAPFICPIMMVLMMIGLFKDSKGGCCSHHKDKETNQENN